MCNALSKSWDRFSTFKEQSSLKPIIAVWKRYFAYIVVAQWVQRTFWISKVIIERTRTLKEYSISWILGSKEIEKWSKREFIGTQ